MASPVNAVFGALLATAFWTVLGFAVSRHVLPRVLALAAAPVVGWAVFSAATLPVLTLLGFSPSALAAVGVLILALSAALIIRSAPAEAAPVAVMPPWSFAAAGLLALAPASAILPKYSGDASHPSVYLADPIFDHAKVALIDAMTRQGLPPVDPVFGEFGAPGRLAYYYLWHFSAAELSLPLRISGWEADIALTWFTAFASLTLMMGIAVWLGRRSYAALIVVVLAAGASMRGMLNWLCHTGNLEPFLTPPTGLAGWLFQSSWAPQHLMAASCIVTAMLLVAYYAQRQDMARLLTLALVAAAGFGSSAYVGGITFAIAALTASPFLFAGVMPARRLRFIAGLAAAAVLAICLAAPFIRDQLAAVAVRGGGSPIVLHPFEVLGDLLPQPWRRVLDVPAYWLILLPIEFPAIYIAGTISLVALRHSLRPGPEKLALVALTALAVAGLCIPWLLVGTLGDNNDLGLRAILPAIMVLIVGTAIGLTALPRRGWILAAVLGGLILGLPDTIWLARSNLFGRPVPDGQIFARSPELWAAVRRYTPPTARVANNPLYLQDLTPWPANMSWALISDRSSCFAGREMALAFAPLPAERREAINAQFLRVFAGQGAPDDVDDMAKKFACEVVVVVPQDGAWSNDPFAASADYRLAEAHDGQWRIYVRIKSPQTN
ncbi:MAG TPA: hypothetical protein VGH13_05485 [Xanthobacteraceae bacterium]|jgi:hypothetical protein